MRGTTRLSALVVLFFELQVSANRRTLSISATHLDSKSINGQGRIRAADEIHDVRNRVSRDIQIHSRAAHASNNIHDAARHERLVDASHAMQARGRNVTLPSRDQQNVTTEGGGAAIKYVADMNATALQYGMVDVLSRSQGVIYYAALSGLIFICGLCLCGFWMLLWPTYHIESLASTTTASSCTNTLPAHPLSYPAQPEYLDFQCPIGNGPGDLVQVTLPDGNTMEVTVPPGVYGGMPFSVEV